MIRDDELVCPGAGRLHERPERPRGVDVNSHRPTVRVDEPDGDASLLEHPFGDYERRRLERLLFPGDQVRTGGISHTIDRHAALGADARDPRAVVDGGGDPW